MHQHTAVRSRVVTEKSLETIKWRTFGRSGPDIFVQFASNRLLLVQCYNNIVILFLPRESLDRTRTGRRLGRKNPGQPWLGGGGCERITHLRRTELIDERVNWFRQYNYIIYDTIISSPTLIICFRLCDLYL